MTKWILGAICLPLAIGLFPLIGSEPQKIPEPRLPREPWTQSKIRGTPEPPPPFKLAREWVNARFVHPTAMAFAPGSRRAFVTEQEGKVFSLANDAGAKPELMIDLRKDCRTIAKTSNAKHVDQLYGIVFHPKFEENRFLYLCYTVKADGGPRNFPDGTRVSRFKVAKTEPPRIDPESEEIVLTYLEGGHNGGCLLFGKDGFLYISTGDSADPSPPDSLRTGQDNSDLLSCVLRIDVDHPTGGKNYSIPRDNPFIGQKQYDGKEIRPEIWAFGFRNPWKMSFDRANGDLWVGDVGWELWEMVHKVPRGGNHGWSIMEANQPINATWPRGPGAIIPPVIELPHTQAASITGGYVYRGCKFPQLVGRYIFGDWETKRVWAAKITASQLDELKEIVDTTARVVAFGEDDDGELHILDYDAGTVSTLAENKAEGDLWKRFPKTLAETGLFESTADHRPAKGIAPFGIQAEQWQDGASAERLLALPGDSFVKWYDQPKAIPGQVDWHQYRLHPPKDAVFVKTLSLESEVGRPATRKRVETQILHFDGEQFRGYSYRWRNDQSNADLVSADGDESDFDIVDKSLPHPQRRLTWNFSARAQCLQCHNAWAEGTLGFQIHQLSANSLIELSQKGMIRRYGNQTEAMLPEFQSKQLRDQKRLANPHDEKSPLQDRARAYLHANCGHCHRFGGGGSVQIVLNYELKNAEMNAIGGAPLQGHFGLRDPKLISPGHAECSVLLYRLAKFGSGRMPHLGSDWPDPRGCRMVADWIDSLGKPLRNAGEDAEASTSEYLRKLLTWPSLPMAERTAMLEAAKSASPFAQDLFSGYAAIEPGERKLGTNPKPQKILGLKGDADKGRELFHRQSLQCLACHKMADKGLGVGPELTKIGASRRKPELLESILQPSRRIEQAYQVSIITTTSGKVATGIPIRRTAKEIVLRTATNEEIVIAVKDVETNQISSQSMMPDGLLRDLTAQQASDLLEYLATRK